MMALVTTFAVDLLRFGADAQRAGRMPETHRVALAAAGGQVDQRAGDCRGGADGHRCRAHRAWCSLPMERARTSRSTSAAATFVTGDSVVHRLGHKGDLGRVLALGGPVHVLDQAHAQRPVDADGLEHRQRVGVTVDGVLQLGAGVADAVRVDEDGRDAGVDHGGLERADARRFQVVDHVTGREHRAAGAFFLCGRVHELDLHFGDREGHAVELEVASRRMALRTVRILQANIKETGRLLPIGASVADFGVDRRLPARNGPLRAPCHSRSSVCFAVESGKGAAANSDTLVTM